MFRLFTLFALIALLGLALVACSGAGTPATEPTTAPATQAPPTTEPAATDAPAPEPTAVVATAAPEPTAEPTAEPATAALCPDLPRPALVLTTGSGYEAHNPQSGERCPLPLPEGAAYLQAADDLIYFVLSDYNAGSSVVSRMGGDNIVEPLESTRVTDDVHYMLRLAVTPDESRLAWTRMQVQEDPNTTGLLGSLWIGTGDGGAPVTVFEDLIGGQLKIVSPIRFSGDGQTLFFTWEPTGLGGMWAAFNGRYNDLWRVPVTGGEPQKIFACEDAGLFLCLGDFRDDGTLAYIDADRTIHVVGPDGAELAAIPTAGDYAGYPTFNPTGDLFYSVADLDETSESLPLPEPGTVYRVAPPYSGEPVVAASGDGLLLSAMRDVFLDDEQVVVSSAIDEQWGTALLSTTTGETTPVEPWPNAYPAAIWR